jgi:hypothetical protein
MVDTVERRNMALDTMRALAAESIQAVRSLVSSQYLTCATCMKMPEACHCQPVLYIGVMSDA